MSAIQLFYPEYAKVIENEYKTNNDFKNIFNHLYKLRNIIETLNKKHYMLILQDMEKIYDLIISSNLTEETKKRLNPIKYCKTVEQMSYFQLRQMDSNLTKALEPLGITPTYFKRIISNSSNYLKRFEVMNFLIKGTDNKEAIALYKKELELKQGDLIQIRQKIIALINKKLLSLRDTAILLNINENQLLKILEHPSVNDFELNEIIKDKLSKKENLLDDYSRSIPKEITKNIGIVSTPKLFNLYKKTKCLDLCPYKRFNDSKTMYRLIMMDIFGSVKKAFNILELHGYEWSDYNLRAIASKDRLKLLIDDCTNSVFNEFLSVRLDHTINDMLIRKLRRKYFEENIEVFEWIKNIFKYDNIFELILKNKTIGYRRTRDIYSILKYLKPKDKRIEIFNTDSWELYAEILEYFK